MPYLSFSQVHLAEFICEIEPEVFEVSGIVSTDNERLFVIGDSGNEPYVYEINRSGKILNAIHISNAQNIDWEELQLDSDGNLYIGDTGNNLSQRTDLVIYKIPNFTDSLHLSSIDYAETITYNYEDQVSFGSDPNGEFNSEAFILTGDEIHIFSKDHSQQSSKIYSIPALPGDYSAKLIYTTANNRWLTGAFYDHEVDIIFFTSLNGVRSFSNYSNAWLEEENCFIELPIFESIQIESLTQLSSGELFIAEDVEDNSASKLYSLFTSCLSEPKITMGPNPSDRTITIRSERFIQSFILADEKGSMVKHGSFSFPSKKIELDISTLLSGIYLLKVNSGDMVFSKRIVKK